MAKIKTPSYIKYPGGRMEDAVLYTVKGRTYMRRYVIPRNPRTEKQTENRSLFAEAMHSWKGLPDKEKEVYRRRTANLPMHPHNLYISEYIKRERSPEGEERTGSNPVNQLNSITGSPVSLRSLPVAAPYPENKASTNSRKAHGERLKE